MTAVERIELIRERIQTALAPDFLQVLDESDAHLGHAGHQGGGRHFAIVIDGKCLQPLSRIAAHRKIYALLQDQMPHAIHALRIQII